MNKINPEEFADAIMDWFSLSEKEIKKIVRETAKEVGGTALSKAKSKSPYRPTSGSRSYKLQWERKIRVSPAKDEVEVKVVQSKAGRKGSLSHLLELGHVTRNGISRTREFPHIRQTEWYSYQEFLKEIDERLEGKFK